METNLENILAANDYSYEEEEQNQEEEETQVKALEGSHADELEQQPAQDGQDSTVEDQATKYYTQEELITMGKSETLDKLDTSRIPPELTPIYKSLQSMATKRQQAIVQKEKELDQRLAEIAGNDQQPVDIQQLIIQNPELAAQRLTTSLGEVNKRLQEAHANDDLFKVQELLIQKDQIRDSLVKVNQFNSMVKAEWQQLHSVVNLKEKGQALTDFILGIVQDDPLTPQELNLLTNPAVMGHTATKLVKLINAMYTRHDAAEKKLVKPQPKAGLQPGSGVQIQPKPDVAAIRKKALGSGDVHDWAEYVANLTKKDT